MLISARFKCVILPCKWHPFVTENFDKEVLVRKVESRNERRRLKEIADLTKEMSRRVEKHQSRVEIGMCTGLCP